MSSKVKLQHRCTNLWSKVSAIVDEKKTNFTFNKKHLAEISIKPNCKAGSRKMNIVTSSHACTPESITSKSYTADNTTLSTTKTSDSHYEIQDMIDVPSLMSDEDSESSSSFDEKSTSKSFDDISFDDSKLNMSADNLHLNNLSVEDDLINNNYTSSSEESQFQFHKPDQLFDDGTMWNYPDKYIPRTVHLQTQMLRMNYDNAFMEYPSNFYNAYYNALDRQESVAMKATRRLWVSKCRRLRNSRYPDQFLRTNPREMLRVAASNTSYKALHSI